MFSFLILLAAALFVALVRYMTRRDPLVDIPGPWLAKHTPLLLAFYTRTGKRFLLVDALHKRYGPLVRLAPSHVSCASPAAPGIIYAQGSRSLPKSSFYRAFYVDGTPSLFSTQDRAGHAQKRRLLAHPFSYASVRSFEPWIRTSLRKLVHGLDNACCHCDLSNTICLEKRGRAGGCGCSSRAGATRIVDILMWLNYMTFDVISDLAFGQPLGMLDRASDVLPDDIDNDDVKCSDNDNTQGVASMIDHRGRVAAFLGLCPTLLPLIRWVSPAWIPDQFVRRGLSGTEALARIARRCVKRRLHSQSSAFPSSDQTEQRGDLLDKLVDGMRRAGSDGGAEGHVGQESDVREEDVVTEAMLLLTAGSDTTANSTAAVLFHILRHPRVLDTLRTELADATRCGRDGTVGRGWMDGEGEDEANGGDAGLVCFDHIKSLKYLQATIDEGLRMFATNAFGLPRVVPPGGSVTITGRTFGEGTELSAPAYTIQHDPAIWGDPEVFRPERWMEGGALPATWTAPGTATDIRPQTGTDDVAGNVKTGAELRRYLLTFGMGPRACIGKNLAYMQMQLLVATLVLRYDMELRDNVMESVEGFMHKPVEVWVRLRRRDRERCPGTHAYGGLESGASG